MSRSDYIDFEIAELIGKYLRNEIDDNELAVLEKWKTEKEGNRQLWNKLTDGDYTSYQLKQWPDDSQSDALWARLKEEIHDVSIDRRKFPIWRIVAGFALFIMAGLAVFYVFNKEEPASVAATSITNELPPTQVPSPTQSGDGVTLIMGDGQVVALGEGHGLLREVDGTQIDKNSERLSYAASGKALGSERVMHTVMTPAARTYSLVLADGTKVWLNASSSIQYPTVFEGRERRVTLRGEAYFEVAYDKAKLFIVNTEKSRIQVLGTHFNIKSYRSDDTDKTSLFSGSVNVTDVKHEQTVRLQPGFEATVGNNSEMLVQKTDLDKVLAWRKNLFVFENERLESLLLELSTWYGIHVHFADAKTKDYHFSGRLQRYDDVQTLLDIITETAKVRFSLKNDQLIVKEAK